MVGTRLCVAVVVVLACSNLLVNGLPAALSQSGLCSDHPSPKAGIEGEQSALELEKITFHPQDSHPYTCKECARMKDSLQGFCKGSSAVSNNQVGAFVDACVMDTRGMSESPTVELRSKCQLFHRFVADLYCPHDPCVQISTEINLAPNSVCGLMNCDNKEEPEIKPFNPDKHPPLTCGQYVKRVSDLCEKKDASKSTNDVLSICDSYEHLFERKGCQVVVPRMASLVEPADLCAALLCEPVDMRSSHYCDKVLHLPSDKMVLTSEYEMYKAKINGTMWRRENDGIVISSATYGHECHGPVTPTDNFAEVARAACDHKEACTLPHPRTIPSLETSRTRHRCNGEFDIAYTCSATGPKHHIFANATAKYDDFQLDCTRELHDFPTPQRVEHPYAFPPTDVGYEEFYSPDVDTRGAAFIPSSSANKGA